MADLRVIKAIAKDAYFKPSLQFNNVDGSQAVRNAIIEALGGTYSVRSWHENKYAVYEIISETIDAIVPKLLTDQFDGIADVRNMQLGDTNKFDVDDPMAIRVGRVAAGNNDIRRQTITNKSFTISTEWFGAAVYTEFDKFMQGDIDWPALVNKIEEAFKNKIQEMIYEALTQSYTSLGTNDKIDGQCTLDKLVNLTERIQTKSGKPVAVYGTRAALSKIAEMAGVEYYSGNMKDEFNQAGYLRVVRGMTLIEIPQAFKVNSDEFVLDDKKVLVLPQGEKIIGVVMEGEARTIEPEPTSRTDFQLGFETLKKIGVGVLQMRVYGMANVAAA